MDLTHFVWFSLTACLIIVFADNNGKVSRDKCGQLHQELKTNALNHHLPCCSCHNFILTHSCPSTCFIPLGTPPQAAKRACLTSYSSLSSLSSVVSGRLQMKGRYPDSVVGCRITRFANIPHLQRKEIIEAFYSSQSNKLVPKTLSKLFLKRRPRNTENASLHRDLMRDEHVLNSPCLKYVNSHSKVLGNNSLQCHQEFRQKQFGLSLQKCSLLSSSRGISKCRTSKSPNNMELNIESERNVFDWKYEQLQLLNEEIKQNKIKLKKLAVKESEIMPKISLTQIDIRDRDTFEVKDTGLFLNGSEYNEMTNTTSGFYGNNVVGTVCQTSSAIIADETLQISTNESQQSSAWEEHEAPSQITDVCHKLSLFVPYNDRVNWESQSVAKQISTHESEVITKDMVKGCIANTQSVINNQCEIDDQTDGDIESGIVDTSIMNSFTLCNQHGLYSVDNSNKVSMLKQAREPVDENTIKMYEVVISSSEESRKKDSSNVENIDTSILVEDNVLKAVDTESNKLEESFVDFYYIFDSERASDNKNYKCSYTNGTAVGEEQRVTTSAPEVLSKVFVEFLLDTSVSSADAPSSYVKSDEKNQNRIVQKELEGIAEGQLDLFREFFEMVEEKRSENCHVDSCVSGSNLTQDEDTNTFMQFCSFEEGNFNSQKSFDFTSPAIHQVVSTGVLGEFNNDVNNNTHNLKDLLEGALSCLNNRKEECGTIVNCNSTTTNYENLNNDEQDIYNRERDMVYKSTSGDSSEHFSMKCLRDDQQIVFNGFCEMFDGLNSLDDFSDNCIICGSLEDKYPCAIAGSCAKVRETIAIGEKCDEHICENRYDQFATFDEVRCLCKEKNSFENQCKNFPVENSDCQQGEQQNILPVFRQLDEKLYYNDGKEHVMLNQGLKENKQFAVVEMRGACENFSSLEHETYCLTTLDRCQVNVQDKCVGDGDLHSLVLVTSNSLEENAKVCSSLCISNINDTGMPCEIKHKLSEGNIDLEVNQNVIFHQLCDKLEEPVTREKEVDTQSQIETQELSQMFIENSKPGCFGFLSVKEKIQDVCCSRHDKVCTKDVPSLSGVFGRIHTKQHTDSQCKSIKKFSVFSEYKCVVISINDKLLNLLKSKTSSNFIDNGMCAEVLPIHNCISPEGKRYNTQQVRQLKLTENVCDLLTLYANALLSKHANVSKINLEELHDFSATSWYPCQKEKCLSINTVMGKSLASNICLVSQYEKVNYVMKNTSPRLPEEIIPFDRHVVYCNIPQSLCAGITVEDDVFTQTMYRTFGINPFSFLRTVFLEISFKTLPSFMRKIINYNDMKIDFVYENQPFSIIHWERHKAVVPYYQGMYEKIILHMRHKEVCPIYGFKVDVSHGRNVDTFAIKRTTLGCLGECTENFGFCNNGILLNGSIVDVQLFSPLNTPQRMYLPSTSPLTVMSALNFRNALSQLETYFNKNLYTESQEYGSQIKQSNSPTAFDHETPSAATDFADTEGTLLASHEGSNGCDCASSLCSCNSSNCSCNFSGTVASDLSLSTSSLDIVTALTEAHSVSAENPSLDYYSFSSPVLDMEDPEFSLSDIQESNITSSLNESLNLSSDISFTTQDLEFSEIFSQPQSVNSQKSEVGLSPYLKICFGSSESVCCSDSPNDRKGIVCNYCGKILPPLMDEMNLSANKIFSPSTSLTSTSDGRILPEEILDKAYLHVCRECEKIMSPNRSYSQCGCTSSNTEYTMSTNYQFNADFKDNDSSPNTLPDLSKDRKCVRVQAECKLALSFNPSQQKINIEEESVSGNISVHIELDCSTEQEDECHLVSIQNCVVGYKPHVKKRKSIHPSTVGMIPDAKRSRDSNDSPSKQFSTECRHYKKETQYRNMNKNDQNMDNQFHERTSRQLDNQEERGQENVSIRPLIVKSKSCQDVSLCKRINENLLQELSDCSVDGNCTDYMTLKDGSFANTRVKSHSYQNILHEEEVGEGVYIRKRSSRRRTIDTFFIDGEHIFAVLTPEQGLSPEKRQPDATGIPKILSDSSDHEMYVAAPPIDISSSHFTEFIDSLDYSPITQPSSCSSDISSLSSLPTDIVPLSDIDSPAVHEQQVSSHFTSLY